jgi:hypothetical protein
MIKNKNLIIALTAVFLTVEAALGLLLQTAQGSVSINLRYTAVVFACLFCILFAERSLSFLFTQIALIGTVGADFFLVYLDEIQQLPAMICFSAVQIAYFLKLYFEDGNKTRKKIHVIVRASLSAAIILITLAVLRDGADAVALVSMFYYTNLILNAVFACISFKKNPIFAIGLILFILCDTVIGFSLIDTYLPIPDGSFIYKIIYPGFDLAWAFYLPSQALLAVSLLPKKLSKKHKK